MALRSKLNQWLDRFEDPRKAMDLVVYEMQQQIRHSRIEVGRVLAEKHRLLAQEGRARKEGEQWERKALVALQSQNEALARKALEQKRSCMEIADTYRSQLQEQTLFSEKLKDALRELEAKLAELQARKSLLAVRHQRALAQQKLSKATLPGHSETAETFARLESKVEERESEALAQAELQGGSLETSFHRLQEAGEEFNPEIEEELARLKEKALPATEPRPSLPSP